MNDINSVFRFYRMNLKKKISLYNQGIDIFTGKEKGLVYGRYANPNTSAVADKIARMEMFGLEASFHFLITSILQKLVRFE